MSSECCARYCHLCPRQACICFYVPSTAVISSSFSRDYHQKQTFGSNDPWSILKLDPISKHYWYWEWFPQMHWPSSNAWNTMIWKSCLSTLPWIPHEKQKMKIFRKYKEHMKGKKHCFKMTFINTKIEKNSAKNWNGTIGTQSGHLFYANWIYSHILH